MMHFKPCFGYYLMIGRMKLKTLLVLHEMSTLYDNTIDSG